MVEAKKAVKEGHAKRQGYSWHELGPTPYLTYEEEKELVRFILHCSRMDYGKTRGDDIR